MTMLRTKSLRFSLMLEDVKPESNIKLANTTEVGFSLKFLQVLLINHYFLIDKLSNEPGLEFKEELVFPDGTVYKGQVKDGKRHGFGI